MATNAKFERVIIIVCDSVGVGEAPDAKDFGDAGSNTIKHIAEWFDKNNKDFLLPNLSRWGLSKIVQAPGIEETSSQEALTATLIENSPGKDTTTGHWEIAGTVLKTQFPTYSEGFPKELLDQWCKDNNLPGYLGNCVASGTTIIDELGEEHIATGKPILYTSADSVLQIAWSEDSFGIDRLYDLCKSARKLVDPLCVGRVIARPFSGKCLGEFERTENRKDYSMPPPSPNLLDVLRENNHFVAGVGKIEDIFAHRSVNLVNHTGNNETSFQATLDFIESTKNKSGLIFTNLIDFDQHFGHRRDPEGYGNCLKNFDQKIPALEQACTKKDLIIITADHGNDPTHTGSDHTRENVPLLVWSKNNCLKRCHLGALQGFHNIARLSLEALGLDESIEKMEDVVKLKSISEKVFR